MGRRGRGRIKVGKGRGFFAQEAILNVLIQVIPGITTYVKERLQSI
jgi:hypothetical protein